MDVPFPQALAEHALERARALNSVIIRPDGGRVFKLVSSLIGWRAARRLQVISGRTMMFQLGVFAFLR